MADDAIAQLGTPDLKLEGLQVWIHGRQFPDLAPRDAPPFGHAAQ
jgi:hypothetical protein